MIQNKTVLYDDHVRLGGRVVNFHGWLLPVQYAGVIAEHNQCRQAAAIFDTSHMGQILITGPKAAAELSAVCTQNASAMTVGRCRYGFLLNDQAGILDDTVLTRLGPEEFLLVVNAGPRDEDRKRIAAHVSSGTKVEFLSAHNGKLDVQGPASFKVLSGLVDGVDLASMKYFHAARARCLGRPCIISRTGYTGELGYEILADNADLPAIFAELLRNDLVRPAGLGARDSLRLEMGYPLYGDDLRPDTTPLDAALEGFIDRSSGFIGAAALAATKAARPVRRLTAFRSDSRRKAAPGEPIVAGETAVGTVTSAGFSPSLQISIGMGYIDTAHAATGNKLAVRTVRGDLPIELAAKPLYLKGTFRTAPR